MSCVTKYFQMLIRKIRNRWNSYPMCHTREQDKSLIAPKS